MVSLEFAHNWFIEAASDRCGNTAPSTRALANRIRKLCPLPDDRLEFYGLTDVLLGTLEPGEPRRITPDPKVAGWRWVQWIVQEFVRVNARFLEAKVVGPETVPRVVRLLLCGMLRIPARQGDRIPCAAPGLKLYLLRVLLDTAELCVILEWREPEVSQPAVTVVVRPGYRQELLWSTFGKRSAEQLRTSVDPQRVFEHLSGLFQRYPTATNSFSAGWRRYTPDMILAEVEPIQELPAEKYIASWIRQEILEMANASESEEIERELECLGLDDDLDEKGRRRLIDREARLKEKRLAVAEGMQRMALERAQREQARAAARAAEDRRKAGEAAVAERERAEAARRAARPPLPPVPLTVEAPALPPALAPRMLSSLRDYFLREQAATWWISNQTDDLFCLPFCRIERLDYQVRTALRVLGPLRGRALLSDEVGLGKTVEAGLIIKELLTRGMAKRFLVLTVPSLVDQWEEELDEKFSLPVTTTNHAAARSRPEEFWTSGVGIVASLHTLKQASHVEIARRVQWDILVVDEAHYLRNRTSQAWEAVNSLPRQFLLLLTATPVQNSVEELYNLVMLLQPGQLPTPKEFRARFVDPKRPTQPKEPEELRRLLGQVMIRNTRANAGVKLPPRRAETVLFTPDAVEQAFWSAWESEFRASLRTLSPAQASLWGRLLLQTAGSSPAAWRDALRKFPDRERAEAWRSSPTLESSWQAKCALLLPLTRAEGGVVIFSQYLQTQAAVAEFLRKKGGPVFVVHGGTPAAERQPITEEFRKQGGALLLTHNGTEGRNLQFCHQLVNFDLPWNPMEIEQRIGRLHRLGQKHPVRIFNFVQCGTLQQHLLEILQEKLNLFELVVGETGLILGDRFSSDEFAEEVFRRWADSDGRVAEAMQDLGDELATARNAYGEVKKLDETLFSQNYESL